MGLSAKSASGTAAWTAKFGGGIQDDGITFLDIAAYHYALIT
jgi:hypothetical protein